MRKSRLVLVGVAVAAAAATGTAFTAGNTFSQTNDIAGYGESTVTGATVSTIHYTLDPLDGTKIASVVFITTQDLTGGSASVVLKKSDDTALDTDTCSIVTTTTTCTLTTHVLVSDLGKTALTVVQ